jgi:inner membrane transporter RhtA
MQTTPQCQPALAPHQPALAPHQPARPWAGPALMFGGALSNQLGAATGTLAFGVIGPAGVVAVRQWIAGIVLLAAGRPQWRSFTWAQWWPVLLLASVYGTMNLSLYTAIGRLGLGLAMTLEFLGPLAVALATSRRRADLVCALAAGAGVAVLTRPRPAADYLGIGLGLLAAACWAGYILLNRLIGRRLPGTQGSAAAAGLSALAFVPVGITVLVRHPPTAAALACAAAAGILSSAVPLVVDLFALRRVPAGYFGLFMSVNPVLAAFIGLVILRQSLSWGAWLSIGAIVAANAVSAARRQLPASKRAAAIHPDREDHGRGDDGRPRDPGRAQPLPEQQGREDGAGQRHGREVATLVERGQQADHGDPGPGRPAGRPAPPGRREEGDHQHASGGEPAGRDGDRGQARDPAEEAAGQAAGAPQQPGCHQAEKTSTGPAAGGRGHRGERTHREIAPATRGEGSRKRGAPDSPRRRARAGARWEREARVSSARSACAEPGARGQSPR